MPYRGARVGGAGPPSWRCALFSSALIRYRFRVRSLLVRVALSTLLSACGWVGFELPDEGSQRGGFDAAPSRVDAAVLDAGWADAGRTLDAAGLGDAGGVDGGSDAGGGVDAGADSGVDAGADSGVDSGVRPAPADWWAPQWTHRIRLTLLNTSGLTTSGTADLSDVPLPVFLSGSRIAYRRVQSAGQDLRFVDRDATTVLPHEIEVWDVSGTSIVWVRVPRVRAMSDSDFIWLYYGNPSAPDGQDARRVWSNGYVAVWHFDRDAPSGPRDATGNGHDCTPMGGIGTANRIAGPVGPAIRLDGIDDYFDCGDVDPVDAASALTATAWARTAASGLNMALFRKDDGARTVQFRTSFSGDDLRVSLGGQDPSGYTPSGIFSPGTWNFWAMVFDGSQSGDANRLRIFLNDRAQSLSFLGTVPAVTPNAGSASLTIGFHDYFRGDIDELRISSAPRSAPWLDVQYRATRDALLMYGPEEAL